MADYESRGELPESQRQWPGDGPAGSEMSQKSPLIWEGQRERGWVAMRALASGHYRRNQRIVALIAYGFVLAVLVVAVLFWLVD